MRAASIAARGSSLATQIDSNGNSWAVGVEPLYLDNAVQASVGWPLFEMTLQHGNAPVTLRGILRDGRAWCRVLEFAEEFQISARFEPFALGERRGE